MQSQTHYFLSPVLVYEGSAIKVAMTRALISPRGIYRVFEESEEVFRAFLQGREFHVRLDGREFRAGLVRELGPGGTHYNLRLKQSDQESDAHLRELLRRYGFSSPWRRDFARIPAGEGHLAGEFPAVANLERFSGGASARVRNFSYHGIFLELRCGSPSLGEAVGQKLRFSLMTSRGKILDEATGRVARLYDEMQAPGKLQRGMGIRILEMTARAREAYHGMILENCTEIRRKIAENTGE